MRTSRPPVPGGFGFPIGCGAGVAVTFAVVAAGATAQPVWSVAALTVVVAAVAGVTTPAAALGTVACCWCLHDGFVLGRYGQLVFTLPAMAAAIALAAAALAAAGFARLARETGGA